MQLIFDRKTIFQRFARINFNASLHDEILHNIIEGLCDYLIFFGHNFNKTINILVVRQLHLFEEVPYKKNFTNDINVKFFDLYEDDNLNLTELQKLPKYDIIVANNCLHNINYLESYIKCFYNLLQNGGIFCGNFYGINTLHSLKEVIISNDAKYSQKIHQRFNPTIKGESVASLLQNSGLRDVVVSKNEKSFHFKTFQDSMEFLRNINERCYILDRQKTAPSRNIFTKNLNKQIDLDFEIIEFYCHI